MSTTSTLPRPVRDRATAARPGSGPTRTTDLTTPRAVLAFLLSSPSGLLLVPLAAVLLGARTTTLGWGWADVAVVAVLLAVRPLAEWLFHRLVFHAAPRRVLGRDRQLGVTRAHWAHHERPADLEHALTPLRVVLQGLAGALALSLLAPTWSSRATALTVLVVVMAATEATHLLLHSGWQPRSAWLRRLRLAHRQHHYADDTTWFGLTGTATDRLLGTAGRELDGARRSGPGE